MCNNSGGTSSPLRSIVAMSVTYTNSSGVRTTKSVSYGQTIVAYPGSKLSVSYTFDVVDTTFSVMEGNWNGSSWDLTTGGWGRYPAGTVIASQVNGTSLSCTTSEKTVSHSDMTIITKYGYGAGSSGWMYDGCVQTILQ